LLATKAVQEIQGHRLKWWGLELHDKMENIATFHITEESTGMCFYWNPSEVEITQEDIDSWISVTAKCENAASM
jgi:hypothetical protein